MPIIKKNSQPQVPASTGFGFGFFCGTLLGAIGVYLVATPEGRNLKKTLVEDFRKHQQTFIVESVVPHDLDGDEKQSASAFNFHALIATAKAFIQKPPSSTGPKGHPKTPAVKKKHVFKKK